jgi:tetratricopeptide (TPR) repeat protein
LFHDHISKSVLYKLSFAYYNEGEFLASKHNLERLISLDSTHAHAYNLLGTIVSKDKNFELAEKYYLIAINYNSEEGGFYFNLGKTYSEMGKKEETILYMKKSAKFNFELAKEWLKKNN